MTCPRCDLALSERQVYVPLTGGTVSAYLCEHCHGVWLDRDTLPTLCPTLSHLPERRFEVVALGKRGQGIMRCPRCQSVPFEYTILDVPIDFCARCGGVWLDGDEYEESMLDGPARRERDADKGGAYRRAAREVRAVELTCIACSRPAPLAATYVLAIGLVCTPCYRTHQLQEIDPNDEL